MANLICTYNVTSTTDVGSTRICYYTDSFSDILIDGTSIGLEYDYRFSSTGEHTVEFVLADVTTIGINAFRSCYSLKEITIPDSVTTIGGYSFYDCENLTGVTIPNSVTNIANYAFAHCSSLTSITIPDTVTRIGAAAFYDCENLTGVTIGSGVTIIEGTAFAHCSSLTSITIPDSVTTIGYDAFLGCTSLTSITCKATTAPELANRYVFKDVATGGTLYYPEGSDYSTWLSTDECYLGYYGWNGIEVGGTTPPTPEPPVDPDEPDVPTYPDGEVYEPTEINFVIDYTGETITYTMNVSNIQYYQYWGMEEWVKVTNQNNRFVIEVSPNEGESRTSGFYIDFIDYNGNVFHHVAIITQEGKPEEEPDEPEEPDTGDTLTHSLSVSPSSINATFEYQTYPFTCTSENIDSIEAVYDVNWINVSNTLSGGTVTVDNNSDTTSRNCTITFNGYYNGAIVATDTLKVYQDADDTPYVKILPTNKYEFAWDYEGYVGFEIETYGIDNLTVMGQDIPYTTSFGNGSIDISETDGVIWVRPNTSTRENQEALLISGWKNGEEVAYDILDVRQEGKPEEEPDEPDVPPTPDNPEGEIVTPNQTKTISSSGATFRYNIEANNMQGLGRYYPSDIDWITITYIDDYNFNITVDENEGDERSETIYFVYYDNNGDAFEHELTISQDGKAVEPDVPPTPDEPDVPMEKTPSVVVSKNNINLDNVGDTSIIQVTYINVDEIVPPEVPDGFTIEEIERVESENGIQVKYKITRISPKRQNAQINFKGNTSGGKTATSSNVNLKGEPCPAEVRLSSYSIINNILTFPATGDTFQVDVIANGVNPPYEFSYSIDGNGITCTYNELDYDNGEGDIYWRYKFASIPNNSNSPYTGTITFNYKDELTNKTIELPFYVRYANEGRIEAGAEKYAYDKDGNNLISTNGNRFSISYINMETINEPECDVDWLIVGEGVLDTGVYADERVKYNHSITIQPNEGASRRCTVTFSGKGVDGKNYTFDIEVTQEGDDTVKPIDEGFIELQQLSVVLNADGDAQTFQVKYYDAKTIYEPELAGTWATITELSRTEPVPDTAWNGEECESVIVTYQVTGQPTDSGRQMKVKFKSDINYYDGGVVYMEKDKFIIYQLAEGSTEVQGLVSILRYSNTFTYYGSPTGWNFRVAYDNVTPDTPVISESWCRIAEVKDLNADEYDYYKEYFLEMDTNNSNFSRACTITFIGNAEDDTQIKTPFQFTQQGQEEIVNEGEYANYKGYFMDFEGTLHSVSFITNPRSDAYGDIRLAGDSPVVVSYSENEYLYDPIRTSTCTVKVVSSHYLMNLYSGKAQGTQVILRNEDTNTIEWCGFLQPNLYNQGFTECIEEIEFEASDCLSTLQYLRYEYFYNGNGQPMIVSFKNIVDTIADRCKLINSYVFTQKLYSNSDESKIFDFKEFYISENNFYSEEGEPWTYQEVLEETCKYFGYVCFQWGDRIYFMDYDKYNSDKSMVGYRYVKEDNWYNRNYITLSNPNRIIEKSIRGTGADISLDDVFNKVSVNCNYYNLEHLLPDLFEDELLTERNQMTLTTVVNRGQEIGSKTSYIVYDHKNIKSHFYKPIVGESIHEIEVQPTEDEFNKRTFFTDFVGANIVDMYYLNYSDLNGKTFESKEWEKYLMISQLNRPWCKGPIVGEYDTTKYWENYNFPIMEFTQIPQIFIDNHKEVYESNTTTGGRVPTTRVGFGTSSSTPNSRPSINTNKSEHYLVIRAEGAFTPFFVESYVPENVDEKGFNKWSNTEYGGYTFDLIKDTTKKEQNFAPKLTFYLEIPTAGWWDGSKWVDYETWFEVPLEELHYSDEIWYSWKNTQNKVETNLFLGISGYKIQLPESMESTAFMQFKIGMPKRFAHVSGGDDNGEAGNAFCFIKNLEMDIVSRNTALLKDEDIVYENVIDDNNVVDGPEWDLKITSDNNITYSFSTVSTKYGEDMVNTTNFRFYDMEGELILPEERIIERFVNQYSTPTLKENMTVDMTFTPAQMVTDTYWDKNFVIVGQEIDYQMCRQEITLLEKK